MVALAEKLAEVRRILDRDVVEVVERFDLCPWAKSARLAGEVSIEVLWGEPSETAWVEAAQALIARPETRVAMVVAPESAVRERDLRELRNLSLLAAVRNAPASPDRIRQVQMLGGTVPAQREDIADMLAVNNHARVSADTAALIATLDSIAADRREAYARVGIRSSR